MRTGRRNVHRTLKVIEKKVCAMMDWQKRGASDSKLHEVSMERRTRIPYEAYEVVCDSDVDVEKSLASQGTCVPDYECARLTAEVLSFEF